MQEWSRASHCDARLRFWHCYLGQLYLWVSWCYSEMWLCMFILCDKTRLISSKCAQRCACLSGIEYSFLSVDFQWGRAVCLSAGALWLVWLNLRPGGMQCTLVVGRRIKNKRSVNPLNILPKYTGAISYHALHLPQGNIKSILYRVHSGTDIIYYKTQGMRATLTFNLTKSIIITTSMTMRFENMYPSTSGQNAWNTESLRNEYTYVLET